ncbi:MAG: hypothetical protein LBC70_04870 [Chitinispirillales bacterium]|jgi:hypothetical protein|nr:hypothetical protein [Chitinispirillales bacterium]
MRNILLTVTMAAFALIFAAGCGNQQSRLNEAAAAENSGNHREAATLFTAAALRLSPSLRLQEAQKGKVADPSNWLREIEKYKRWLTDPAAQRDNSLGNALDGLVRCAERIESENIINFAEPAPFDSLPAFTTHWNQAFNPPPAGTIDWNGLVSRAYGQKFSILRVTSPQNYTYEISIVSRKTSRRVNLTLFPESNVNVPLPPAEYIIILRSMVEFQQGQRWTSEYASFNLSVTDEPSLIAANLRTWLPRRQ